MENAKYSLDLQRSPAVIYVFSQGLKYEVYLKDGATFVEMAGSMYPVPGCPFPVELASARFWAFIMKNEHSLIRVGIGVAALIALQICLMAFIGGDFLAMSISYFSLFMNTTLCLLFCMVVLAYCGQKFFANFSFTMFPDTKEDVKLLDIGQVSIGADIPVFSLVEDEAAESFEARMRAAIESAGDEKWVVVMPFKHHMTSIYMGLEADGETVLSATFLRHLPFTEGPFTEQQISEAMQYSKKQSFTNYLSYCRGFASEYITWSAAEKMPKCSPFETIVSTMKSAATCLALLLFSFAPAFAQKTKQVEAYLGDRATLAVPEKGKEVSFVFERREISVISQGENYIGTLKSVPFFQDVSDAGRLLLIKVGNQKILPKQPTKQKHETSEAAVSDALPIPESVPGGGFYESLPDSLEANALINKDKADRQREWVQVKPSVGLWMYRFHRLMIGLFILGCFLWVVAVIGASESVNDLGAIKVVSDFLVSVYVVSKSALIGIWIFALGVYTLEAMITNWFTGELSAYFFGKFVFMAVFSAVLFKWVFPDLQKRQGGNTNIVRSNYPGQRQLNG